MEPQDQPTTSAEAIENVLPIGGKPNDIDSYVSADAPVATEVPATEDPGVPKNVSAEIGGVMLAFSEVMTAISVSSPAGSLAAATHEVGFWTNQAGQSLMNGQLFAGTFDLDTLLETADQLSAQTGSLNHRVRKELGKPRASQALLAGKKLQDLCFGASEKAGWWKNKATGLNLIEVIREPKDPMQKLLAGALVAQKLCLSHSEISEAMEGHRKGLMDDKLPHRSMIEVEIADAIIRLFDLGGALGLDLGGAIDEKMAFNAIRPDHKIAHREAAGGKAY